MVTSSCDSPVTSVWAWGNMSADSGWPLASMAMEEPVNIWWPLPDESRLAQDAGGGFVVGAHVSELVEEHDPFAQRRHHRLVALLGRPPTGFGLPGVGELRAHDHPARGLGGRRR